LTFWAGLPWALKMPIGHVVDLIWRWKELLVYLGAALIALSIAIMYGLIAHTALMSSIMSVEAWFVLSFLLAPTGYVIQDVVADGARFGATGSLTLPCSDRSLWRGTAIFLATAVRGVEVPAKAAMPLEGCPASRETRLGGLRCSA